MSGNQLLHSTEVRYLLLLLLLLLMLLPTSPYSQAL
jgi:hypothetical protein